MVADKKMFEAFDKIESIIEIPTEQKTLVTPSLESLCDQYNKIKKYLEFLLPMIMKILPKIAIIIQFLMTIADKMCMTSDIKKE